MRKITEIKAIFSKAELLEVNQSANIKGGILSTALTTAISAAIANPTPTTIQAAATAVVDTLSAVADDKRRPRPGGGASTQLTQLI